MVPGMGSGANVENKQGNNNNEETNGCGGYRSCGGCFAGGVHQLVGVQYISAWFDC